MAAKRTITNDIQMTDEILAHVAAPATRQTDQLYQALADAYRDFEPCTSLRDPAGSAAPRDAILTSRESYGSFPSHLSSEDQDPDASEYNAPPTSSRLAQLERMHQNWKKKNHATTSVANLPGIISGSYADTAFIEETQEAMLALHSQLPVHASMTFKDTSDSEPESDDATPVLQALDGHHDLRDAIEEEVEVPLSALGMDNTSVHVQAPATRPNISKEVVAVEILDLSKLPINVFPPPPKISVAQHRKLPSQITPYLADIKTRHPKRFNLITKKYTPEPYDRGYWAVDCAQWPRTVQIEFWLEMQGHVQRGELGWGTTLHRAEESMQAIGQLRLYCWAEVAEHMWLQLWLSAGGQVAGQSVKWYDADGRAILEAVLGSKDKEFALGSGL